MVRWFCGVFYLTYFFELDKNGFLHKPKPQIFSSAGEGHDPCEGHDPWLGRLFVVINRSVRCDLLPRINIVLLHPGYEPQIVYHFYSVNQFVDRPCLQVGFKRVYFVLFQSFLYHRLQSRSGCGPVNRIFKKEDRSSVVGKLEAAFQVIRLIRRLINYKQQLLILSHRPHRTFRFC